MVDFIFPLIGGVLIGISALLLMYFLGKICGISNIYFSVIKPGDPKQKITFDRTWQCFFILGLPIGVWLAMLLFHHSAPLPPPNNIALVIISGLLVGIGVKLGNGCTSGHGVCGISRLSLRSIVATLVFMIVAIATVLLVK